MENCLKRFDAREVFNMVKFIVDENFNHHSSESKDQNHHSEINAVYDEELTFIQDSEIFVEKDIHGSIQGTIRVLKWNFLDTLPIQKIFGINPMHHLDMNKVNDVFHFGRLAIRKDCPSLSLLKKMIASAIAPVCQHKQNVAFAECDHKLFRTLSILGIKMKVIGKSIHYLGSETIPVMIPYKGLIDFHLKSQKAQVRKEEKIRPQIDIQYRPKLAFGI